MQPGTQVNIDDAVKYLTDVQTHFEDVDRPESFERFLAVMQEIASGNPTECVSDVLCWSSRLMRRTGLISPRLFASLQLC